MIWILGKEGLLGKELVRALSQTGSSFVATGREVDVTSPGALKAFFGEKPVRWMVNCAAYTAVDRAETDQKTCREVNALGPQNLGRLARQGGARVLHFSTDYVFDGRPGRPYSEEDEVSPLSVYGRTKAEGEALLREAHPQAVILRTSWLYGSNGPDFVSTMLRLFGAQDSVGVVADQWGNPTWTNDLVRLVLTILEDSETGGLYHASGEGETSWFDFASAIAEEGCKLGLIDPEKPLTLTPLSSKEYPAVAPRPPRSGLNKEKLRLERGWVFPPWRESLKAHLSELKKLRNGKE